MANRQMQTRLSLLEERRLPRWRSVLTVPHCSPNQWDSAVEAALQAAPEPPPGYGYLIVPETCPPDQWEAYAEAEMSWMRQQLELGGSPHD